MISYYEQPRGLDQEQVWLPDEVTAMSSIGITSSLSNLSQAASIARTAPDASTATPSARLTPDIVTLSISGQAKLLHQQGNSPGLIASNLGIKVADVDGYLGINVAVPTAATPAPSEASAQSAPTSTRTEVPEATVLASPAPQPVAIKAPTSNS